MNPQVRWVLHDESSTYSYVVWDPQSRRGVVIDPALDFDPKSGRTGTATAEQLVAIVEAEGLTIDWILETHAHADHISAAPFVRDRLGNPPVGVGEGIRIVQQRFKRLFNLERGFLPDGNFPGGDARQLFQSSRRLFEGLDDATRMYLLHDYGPNGRERQNETTVGQQRRENIHVHDGASEDEYVRMREDRDATLAMPTLIIPSVQVNIRAGHFPPPEDNGVTYFKVPIDAFDHKALEE